jgi:hypothetical protein
MVGTSVILSEAAQAFSSRVFCALGCAVKGFGLGRSIITSNAGCRTLRF